MLKDNEVRRRVAAGETLAHLYGDKTGVAPLLEGVAHTDAALRFQAAFGLAFAQTETGKALPVNAEMQRADDATRSRALTAFQRIAAVDEAAIPLLIAALPDNNFRISVFTQRFGLANSARKQKPLFPR
jgi:HEAT repeat protein